MIPKFNMNENNLRKFNKSDCSTFTKYQKSRRDETLLAICKYSAVEMGAPRLYKNRICYARGAVTVFQRMDSNPRAREVLSFDIAFRYVAYEVNKVSSLREF